MMDSDLDFSAVEAIGGAGAGEEFRHPPLEKKAGYAAFRESLLHKTGENLREAEVLRREILGAARDGADLQTLYPLAVRCIARLCGDTAFEEMAMPDRDM